MQIVGAQIGNSIYPLVEGQPLPVVAGDTIRVFYTFKYRMPIAGSVRVWASLWLTGSIPPRVWIAQTKKSINLEAALDWATYNGEIDIIIGDVTAHTYGIICELPDYTDAWARIDDCLEVAAAPSIWSSISSLVILGLMVGVMSMITPKEGE